MASFFKPAKIAIFAAAAALTAASFAGCGVKSGAIQADTYTVEKQELKNSVSVSGTVKGCDLVKITSTIAAPIQTLNVELGDYVKKGDVLCTFDSSSLQEEYDNLKKNSDLSDEMALRNHEINLRNLKNAKAEKETAVAQAQRAINDAQNTRDKAYEKYNKLVENASDAASYRDYLFEQAMSTGDDSVIQEYEAAVQACRAAEAERDALYEQLDSYDSAVQSARDAYNSTVKSCDAAIQSCQDVIDAEKYSGEASTSQLDKLKEQIDNCIVKAPRDGIITSLNVAEGNIPTTDAIMTIEDDSALKISSTVREADILKIKEGMKAIIKTSATKDQEFIGEVTKVVNIFNNDNSNPYIQSEGGYTVEVTVRDTDNVFIGMNAKVEIIIDEKSDVIAVPYDAIVEEDDASYVYVAKESGSGKYKAEAVKVTPQMETDYFIEIESADIKEGDLIVLTDMYKNTDVEFSVRTGGLSDDE